MADKVLILRSLSPEYQPDEHGEYVRILMVELQRSGHDVVRNIALTGHYGSGKSSVLVEVQRQLITNGVKAINLSLPSLGIGDARLETPGDKTTLDTTNLIQKEIVKQLLYRRKPSDTPASRYNRLDIFRRGPAYRRAAGAAAGLTALALLAGVPHRVQKSLPSAFWAWLVRHSWSWVPTSLQWLSLAVVFALTFGAVVWAQRLFFQRLRLTELAAGPAKVTLSENSTSFFDEYLDEIVYFFQNSGTTVVVFEDLDRFEDPHIFETLRELNLLLNNAEQTGNAPIRFIYAIRDSIFEKLDEDNDLAEGPAAESSQPVKDETRRLMSTNRTKFFDLVIPVVPFISHRTSRELIRNELSTVDEAQRPSAAVIDLVSVYLTDMRLIKNICNEYDVFCPRILSANGLDGLTPDRLFASIVYKNIYMGDYERIRNAESLLDDLYAAYREWVASRATEARASETRARARLNRISASAVSLRSQRVGHRLQAVLAVYNNQGLDPNQTQVIVGSDRYSWSQLLEPRFWSAYLSSPQNLSVIYHPAYGAANSLSFEAVQTLIGEQLSSADWDTSERTELRRQMAAANVDQRRVAQASLTDAIQATSKLFEYRGRTASLDEVATELLKGADLAVDLLRSGYIDENYSLYVTQFPGGGSAVAMNFILKAVQPDVMDIEYHFGAPKDIDTVIQAEGTRLLQGQSVYNVEVFDHLLITDADKLADPIHRLASNADADTKFIEAYLSAGMRPADFIQRLSTDWTGIFRFVIGDNPEMRGLDLLDAALRGADPSKEYELVPGQREAIVTALPSLTVIASSQSLDAAQSIARVLQQFDVRATDLADISEPLLSEVAARNLYEITRQNLTMIVGGDQLSLDRLKDRGDEIYQYMLDHLSQYVIAIQATAPIVTVANAGRFAEVLVDVANKDPEMLTDIAAAAADGCLLDDLSVLDTNHWSAITEAHRLRLSVPLISQYIAELDFDDALVDYLTASRAFEVTEGEPAPLELAMKVLNSSALDNDTKMALVDSLQLTRDSITASSLEKHAHVLIPRLVQGGWITDDGHAFATLGNDEWPVKKALIECSKKFLNYMTSLTLSPRDLQDLTSPDTSDVVKEVLLRNYATFEPTLAEHGAKNLATWLAAKGHKPDGHVLVSLATKGGGPAAGPIINLLGAQATAIDRVSLIEALNALGKPFDQLTNPGRDRPKVPNHAGTEAVLTRLRDEHIVSTYEENAKKSRYEVTKRYS